MPIMVVLMTQDIGIGMETSSRDSDLNQIQKIFSCFFFFNFHKIIILLNKPNHISSSPNK